MKNETVLNEKKIRLSLYLETLDREGSVRLRLKGNCMWPTVKNADWLTVEKWDYQKLAFGDVALFKISDELLHVNTRFSLRSAKSESAPDTYIGRVKHLERQGKKIDLSSRNMALRIRDTLLSPANPYLLGLPIFLGKKIKAFFKR